MNIAELGRRLELTSAADMVAVATWVADNEPDRGATSTPLGGGHVVITGRGLFVNAAMACGLDAPLTNDDLHTIESISAEADLAPIVQVSEFTHPDVVRLLVAKGYVSDDARAGAIHDLSDIPAVTDLPFDFDVVESDAELLEWQEAAAESWGHRTVDRRAASDTFAEAAHAIQTPGLLLVRDREDGRVVGCTALSVRDELAILGGMSTLPAERNRGVQHACIQHRLQLAAASGCTGGATQAAPDSGSLRNLLRAGFTQSHTTTSWMLVR